VSVLSNHLRVEPSRIAGDRTVTLARPNKALSPAWGKSVGGVSESAGAKAGGVKTLRVLSFACRDGRRHPGFLEGSALRGALSERRPWSARFRLSRLPPRQLHAPVTADVRRSPRRGTTSVYAIQGVGTGRTHGTPLHAYPGRVLRSVLRPVLVNPHYTPFG